MFRRVASAVALLALTIAGVAAAGQTSPPPDPIAPEVVSRDANRQATVRAIDSISR